MSQGASSRVDRAIAPAKDSYRLVNGVLVTSPRQAIGLSVHLIHAQTDRWEVATPKPELVSVS